MSEKEERSEPKDTSAPDTLVDVLSKVNSFLDRDPVGDKAEFEHSEKAPNKHR